MGGILAFEVYRQAPERVKGLVLIDTNAADEMPAVTEKRDALVDRAIAGEFSAITREVLLPVLIHPSRMADVTLTDSICGMADNIGIEAFIAHAKALATRLMPGQCWRISECRVWSSAAGRCLMSGVEPLENGRAYPASQLAHTE